MTTLFELAESHPHLAPVAEELGRFESFRNEHFTLNTTGDCNEVLIGDESVVKIAHGESKASLATATFEASVICDVHDATTPPPVDIPHIVESRTVSGDNYTAYSKVPGTVLSHEQLRILSRREKSDLGHRIGTFVAWMGSAVSISKYQSTLDFSKAEVFDRADTIEHHAARARNNVMPKQLDKVLREIEEQYHSRLADGSLEPTIIGHDDLRSDNFVFVRDGNIWKLNGIFDFGLTKPSSPERELRHVAALGSAALGPAIAAYEAIADTTLSRDLIQFWAVTQTATAYSSFLQHGNMIGANPWQKDLAFLLPERDWYGFR
jgi:Ser/Thr protein kinase RdoA (MazF antagonist)